jgi:hypothetical protein
MVFDDTIVNDCDALSRVWVGVLLVRTAVCGPARMADSYAATERLATEHTLEILEFSDRSPARKETAFKSGKTGGIISAIFKPPQRIQNWRGGWPSTHETNDTTHLLPSPIVHHLPREITALTPLAGWLLSAVSMTGCCGS